MPTMHIYVDVSDVAYQVITFDMGSENYRELAVINSSGGFYRFLVVQQYLYTMGRIEILASQQCCTEARQNNEKQSSVFTILLCGYDVAIIVNLFMGSWYTTEGGTFPVTLQEFLNLTRTMIIYNSRQC